MPSGALHAHATLIGKGDSGSPEMFTRVSLAHVNQLTAPGSTSYLSIDLGLDTPTTNDVQDGTPDDSVITLTARQILILFNSTGGALVITVQSVADDLGRTASSAQQDISIPAGETHLLGPYFLDGWAQTGLLKFTTTGAGLRAAIVTLPALT